MVDIGYTMDGIGYTMVGIGYKMVGIGYTTVGFGYTMVGFGYTMVGIGYTMVEPPLVASQLQWLAKTCSPYRTPHIAPTLKQSSIPSLTGRSRSLTAGRLVVGQARLSSLRSDLAHTLYASG